MFSQPAGNKHRPDPSSILHRGHRQPVLRAVADFLDDLPDPPGAVPGPSRSPPAEAGFRGSRFLGIGSLKRSTLRP